MAAWLLTYRSSMTDPPPVREDWAERTARGTAPPGEAYRCPDKECVFRSPDLRVMVAHATAHRDDDAEARAIAEARRRAAVRRIRDGLALLPDLPDPPPPPPPPGTPDQAIRLCWCGCGVLTTRPRYASDACRYRAGRARKRARTAPQPAPAVAAAAGLASAAGAAPAPVPAVAAAAVPCACGCGLPVIPARGHGNGRKFATRQCGKRQQRRDERQRYRELIAAAAVPWPPVPPASTGAVTGSARCLSSVG